jgi:transposase InsO family protein
LELAHARFIRPSRALLAASSAEVWNDLSMTMGPDSDCISCKISTMKATARIKHPSTPVSKPGQVIYLDILPAVSDDSLTPKSYFPAFLILVDAFSRFTRVIGMSKKSTKSVTAALSVFAAKHRLISSVKLWKIEKIKGDAGAEFNSTEFEQFCIDRHISVSFAPPKHQEGNHFAERIWQSLRKLAQSMLVYARLPDMYMYHALLHACHVFNVLPLKDLITSDGIITTPYDICGF